MDPHLESKSNLDGDSRITLIQPHELEDFDDIELEKAQAYEVWTQRLKRSSRPILSQWTGVGRGIIASTNGLRFLLPSFVQTVLENEPSRHDKVHPSGFLDGMRGLAAFAVFLCHLSYGTWDIVHSYGAGEPGENDWLIQLPIIRLFYSGPPMVAIFFVVSGYALSLKPVKLMRAQQREALLNCTTSSIFRRALRLYLPCFASTFMVVCLVQIGLYDLTANFAANMRNVKEVRVGATATFMAQFWSWAQSMFYFVNPFDWGLFSGTTLYDAHLWTIPVEFRCSLLLFLTHILTARMTVRLRIITIIALCWWGLHWDRWDMIPFWSGQLLAEFHHITISRENPQIFEEANEKSIPFLNRLKVSQAVHLIFFVIGLFLASYPDVAAHVSPGYIWLDSVIPTYWSQRHRFWPNIGAVIIVWTGGHTSVLREIFCSAPIQYLGKISFPLYVLHGPITNTLGYLVMEKSYSIVNIQSRTQFEVAYLFAAMVTIVAVIWAADVFLRAVDTPCVKFTRWLENKFFES